MDQGNGKQGISRQGPLRSITTPPFAGRATLRNSGPLAPALRDSSSNSSVGSGATTDTQTAPYQHGVPPSLSQPLTYQQQPPIQAVFPYSSPNLAAVADMSSIGQQPTSRSEAPAFTLTPAPTSSDPLSDLLLSGVHTGRNAPNDRLSNHDSFHRASNSEFNSRSFPVAQTQAPPFAPEPTPPAWIASVSGDGGTVVGRDHDGSRAAAPPTPSSSQPMPALPPPPTNYAGSSFATSAKHYHPQQLPRAIPPPVVTRPFPPTTPPAPVKAAFRTPPASPQEKSLDQLVSEFLTVSAPPAPEPADQNLHLSDPNGWVAALGQLARRRAWAYIVDVAGKMLETHRRGGALGLTAEQVMTLRLRRASGMLRIGKIEEAAEAASEAARGNGHPPLSTVSIAARFVAASAKSMLSGVAEEEAIDELTALKLELKSVMDSGVVPPFSNETIEGATVSMVAAAVWRQRVITSLTNAFVRRGSWRQALGLLETMGEECASSTYAGKRNARDVTGKEQTADGALPDGAAEIAGNALVAAARVDVLTRIGRVFLQFGALEDAEVYFRRAENTAVEPAHDPRILVNNGLLLFSKNDFVAAQESFQRAAAAAAQAEPSGQRDDDWLWAYLDEGAGLLDCALNNLSLALVYSCDVIGAVQTLEGLIRKDPCLYMLDVVVFNLCTLYDLSFDPVASAKKKRTLQAVAQRFRLEDIDATSFRLS